MKNDLVIIGSFGRPYGVRGFLHLNSYTSPKNNIKNLQPWLMLQNGKQKILEIEEIRAHHQGLVVKLKDCNDRDKAALLTKSKIAVLSDQLPKPQKKEYYFKDLEGLNVINRENINLGKIAYLHSTDANDVMVVES
ncbi:MAG: 16S rRNA processing protein RimM [Gammaproteobacteria bacterium GWE2_37_16]|nr:MAG: 16S rRNA processing protein RimM [Gammaproteobacteria bacterium GWE2_37_16]